MTGDSTQLSCLIPPCADLSADFPTPRTDHCGPIKDVDPEAAAKKRAARRQEATAAAAFSVAGSGDIPEDLADAEEDDPEVGGWWVVDSSGFT